LFLPPPEKPGVSESFEDNELQLEPIDVLVDMIIGCLEKGTAYMRAVGNQSFSWLSGAVKDSTINLILSVSVLASVLSIINNMPFSNWNTGTLRNFSLTRTRGWMRMMGIRKTAVTAMTTMTIGNHPLQMLKTTKAPVVSRKKTKSLGIGTQKFYKEMALISRLIWPMKSLKGSLTMTR
jgi:hypothetical protein